MKSQLTVWMILALCLAGLAACETDAHQPTATPPESPLPVPTVAELSPKPLSSGDLILFNSDREGGTTSFYLMKPDGSAVQRLLFPNAPVNVLAPTWVPVLQQFVFVGKSDGGEDVYLTNWERTAYQNLTNTPDVVEVDPVVSPDGQWVAMVCTWADPDICVISSDGLELRQLTGPPAWDANPVWSPDSQRLVYVSNAEGISDLFLVDIKEAKPRKLTTGEGRHSAPDWSPDGSWIAFQSDEMGVWDIWLISPDGQESLNLTQNPGADQSPKWSPDGQWIGFRSERDGNWEIYVMKANGQEPRNVSQSPEDNETVFVWSPDSQQLLFVSDVKGNLEIFRVNVDGSDKVNLTQNPADDGAPIWIQAP